MTSSSDTIRPAIVEWSFPIALIALGAFFAVFAFQCERIGAEQAGDPGPEFLPAAMGAFLAAGGLWLLSVRWRQTGMRFDVTKNAHSRSEDATRNRAVWGLVIGMFIYLPALTWIGFSVATVVGCSALLLSLKTRIVASVGAALGLVVFAKLLFTKLFEVQLPEGILEDWLA